MSKLFFAVTAAFLLLVTRVHSWSFGGSGNSINNNKNAYLSRRDAILTQVLSVGGVLAGGKATVSPAWAATDNADVASAVAADVTSPLVEVVVSKDAKKVRTGSPYLCARRCFGC